MFSFLYTPARWLSNLLREQDDDHEGDEDTPSDDDHQQVQDDRRNQMDNSERWRAVVNDTFQPTILDVIVVKAMLHRACKLPPEIIDVIADMAEYWPHTSTEITYFRRPQNQRKDARGSRRELENLFLLRTTPLGFVRSPYRSPGDIELAPPPQTLEQEFEPEDFQNLIGAPVATIIHPCRKIVFTIDSHDQGWGGDAGEQGSYNGSWTWFEAGHERCNKTVLPDSKPEATTAAESSPTASDDGHDDGHPHHGPSFDLSALATLSPSISTDERTGQKIFEHPLLPREDRRIQSNVAVNLKSRIHRVVWRHTDDIPGPIPGEPDSPEVVGLALIGRGVATGNGEFVRNLKLGDIVTVWAKARFPGWANWVERVRVDVYWAI